MILRNKKSWPESLGYSLIIYVVIYSLFVLRFRSKYSIVLVRMRIRCLEVANVLKMIMYGHILIDINRKKAIQNEMLGSQLKSNSSENSDVGVLQFVKSNRSLSKLFAAI